MYFTRKLDKQVIKLAGVGTNAIGQVMLNNNSIPASTLNDVKLARTKRAALRKEHKVKGRERAADKIVSAEREKIWEEKFNSLSEAERVEELKYRSEPKNIYKTVKDTGERCRIARPTKSFHSKHIKKWPLKKYHRIRKQTGDIELISKNTGLPKWKIKRIKEHLFYNKHKIREYSPHDNSIISERISRFDPDPEIAAAWDRLSKGDFIRNDIDLLHHEYLESLYERILKTDYNTAHDKISTRWPWRYPKFGE